MTQTLTPAQRTFIVKAIEHDINDAQVSDYYDFGDMHITWVPAREIYLVEQHLQPCALARFLPLPTAG